MRLEAVRSRAEALAQLTREAEAAWGAERLPALAQALDTAAGAVWELAQRPFGLTDEEPDFIAEPE
jgi:hypothetical protein